MERTNSYQKLSFLQGGGEMGERVRAFDWSETSLGAPDNWPQSLRTTVSILLNSRFPMFLFWGPELICFYNDAFRPSLGNEGKHPLALGQRGQDCWPEIWDRVGPLISSIMDGGEAIWQDDQLIPIYRNGNIEEVFWTYSYSAVHNEAGDVGGVLAVCNEVTEKVRSMTDLGTSEERFQNLVRDATIGIVMLAGEDWIVKIANDAYARLIGRTSREIIGKKLFEVLPEAREGFAQIMFEVMRTGKTLHLYDQSYTVFGGDGELISGYLNIVYQPYRERDGAITGLIVMCQDVTEQVVARKKIEESEHRIRTLIEASPVRTILLTGEDLVIELANEHALKGWGKGRDVFGKTILEVLPEMESQPFPKILREVYRSGQPFRASSMPATYLIDGVYETYYFDLLYQPMRTSEGEVYGVLSTSMDVTERVLGQKAVEESERRMRSLIESAPFPIGVYVGREMRIQFLNKSIVDVWGKGPDVVGKTYSEVLPELAGSGIYEQLDQVYTTGLPFHAKNQLVDLMVDGRLQPYYFNYSFTPLFDAAGKVYGVMNTAAEVTDLIFAKQELERAEVSLRTAVELAELATWTLDIVRGTVTFSQRFMEWFGFVKQTKTLREAYLRLPADYRRPVVKGILQAIKQGSSSVYDNEHPMLNVQTGQEHIIHVQAEVISDDNGRPVALRGMAQDVTTHRRLQQQLEQEVAERTAELAEANAQLQRSNEELTQYAYVASHDLQEPLRKIRVFADMLSKQEGMGASSLELVKKMEDASSRMTLLIKDLLEFSRLLNAEALLRPVDLNVICKSVIADFELSIREKGASVQVGPLPGIEAVGLQMNQLFYNLIGNALKFCKPDTAPQITISSRPLMPGDVRRLIPASNPGWLYYDIAVKDNGIGFDSRYAEQIFEVFKRLHGRDVYPGSGIGLALCRRIALNAKGYLYAESEPGSGATFHVILPDRVGASAAPGSVHNGHSVELDNKLAV